MATESVRETIPLSNDWIDIAAVAGVASIDVTIACFSQMEAQIIFGGATKPDGDDTGGYFIGRAWPACRGTAANIWARTPASASAVSVTKEA